MKKYKHGCAVTVYMSSKTLEELDRYKVQYGTSRSELIEESVISYLNNLPTEEEWQAMEKEWQARFEENQRKHGELL